MATTQPYIVSARKYRPSTFRSVVGQSSLANTLKNAIDTRRLAQAYLFCGPRGVGKTSCARIFAKTINCQNPDPDGEACGQCESCKAIEKGNSFDLVELDAASNNSVDDIRSITEQVNVPPQNGRYRVFIIDEVHMLSNAAFNAFLKTLEEPPANVVFILATTEKHKVIPTILSRCQIYDFKRITVNDMIDHLEYVASQEGVKTEREALGVIALKADGAMRDALSIFDQVAAATGGDVSYAKTLENLNVLDYDYYFRLVDSFREGDVPGALLLFKEIRDKGFDSLFFVNGLASHIRDLMVAFDPRTVKLLETSQEVEKRFLEQAPSLPVRWYYDALKLLNDCDLNYRTATNKRLLVELTLIRLANLLQCYSKAPFENPESGTPPLPPVGEIKAVAKDRGVSPSGNPSAQSGVEALKGEGNKVDEPKIQPQAQKEPSASTITQGEKPSKRTNRPRSFSLTDNVSQRVSEPNNERRESAFTHEDFMMAWNLFIDSNPSLHILVNAMRGAKPTAEAPDRYTVTVEHPAQVQAFEMSMDKLLGFLRGRLSNDMLSLNVVISKEKNQPTRMAPKDFLRLIVEENPALGEFLAKIDAEIV